MKTRSRRQRSDLVLAVGIQAASRTLRVAFDRYMVILWQVLCSVGGTNSRKNEKKSGGLWRFYPLNFGKNSEFGFLGPRVIRNFLGFGKNSDIFKDYRIQKTHKN